MNQGSNSWSNEVFDVLPEQAWKELAASNRSCLVDVRSQPEWTFVGTPDLTSIGRMVHFVEWSRYPDQAVNSGFYDEVSGCFESELPDTVFFICRSGVRSKAAATVYARRAALDGIKVQCINVAEGFEGDLDGENKRGNINGWKMKGLPWRQS